MEAMCLAAHVVRTIGAMSQSGTRPRQDAAVDQGRWQGGPAVGPPAPPPPPVTSTHAATNGRCATDGDPSDALQHFSTSDEPPISDPNYLPSAAADQTMKAALSCQEGCSGPFLAGGRYSTQTCDNLSWPRSCNWRTPPPPPSRGPPARVDIVSVCCIAALCSALLLSAVALDETLGRIWSSLSSELR
jgi:hypothetical protein